MKNQSEKKISHKEILIVKLNHRDFYKYFIKMQVFSVLNMNISLKLDIAEMIDKSQFC